MKVKILKSTLNGKVKIPSSKSYGHRYIIALSLAEGKSIIKNVNMCDDIEATLNCIYNLNKNYEIKNKEITLFDSMKKEEAIYNCNESGSTLRFLIPIALLKNEKATFIGKERLIERGIDIYEEVLKEVTFKKFKKEIEVEGKIESGTYEIDGSKSSQYVTGLLFTLPLLKGDSEIRIKNKLESKNYILMTIEVLKKCGIDVDIFYEDENIKKIYIKGNQNYKAVDIEVEGDISNAAFVEAFNYFGSSIKLEGINENSMQGDIVYKKYFKLLSEKYSTVDIKDSIDLGPVIMAFASLNKGGHITGTKRLKFKESDRGEVMKLELQKFGVDVKIEDNDIYIDNKNIREPKEELCGHNDHRIVMALSLFASKYNIVINGAEAVSKSYPTYFSDMEKIGLKVIK